MSSPFSHPTSPTSPAPPKSKRARPTISCLECRRKKLKCDRVQPCMQCTKSGKQALCTFVNGAARAAREKVAAGNGVAVRSGGGEVVNAESVVGEQRASAGEGGIVLERRGGQLDHVLGEKSSHVSHPTAKNHLGRIFSKGDRSRYLGLGDRMMMLDHFEDVKSFISTGFQKSGMREILAELCEIYQATQPCIPSQPLPCPLASDHSTLLTCMLGCFPSKARCEGLLLTYCTHFEGTFRVLRRHILNASLAELWKTRTDNVFCLPANMNEGIVPHLLGAMAIAARLYGYSVPQTDRVSEEEILKWTALIQRWVDDLKGKEKLTFQALNLEMLLLLIHQNSLAAPADLWQRSGNLVRKALIMGLHHDPEDCQGMIPFEKDTRRKRWRCIVELDIQFSLATGLPTAIRSSDFDPRDLLNLDDVDLNNDMAVYPDGRPKDQWTDSMAQIALESSIKERLDATNMLAGRIDFHRDATAMMMTASALERHLSLLPLPFRSGNDSSPERLFQKIMVDVLIRRPSLNLYRAVALSPLSNQYPEARLAAVQSSIALLSHLDALDPTVADLNTIKDRDLLNQFHILFKNDITQATIMLCIEIRRLSSKTRVDDAQQGSVPWTKFGLTRIVENTLNGLIQRLGEFGSDLKDILPLSVVLQSARSDGTEEERGQLMLRGAERVCVACRRSFPELQRPLPSLQNGSELASSTPAATQQFEPSRWYTRNNPYQADYWQLQFDAPPLGTSHKIGGHDLTGYNFDFQDSDFDFNEWGLNQ